MTPLPRAADRLKSIKTSTNTLSKMSLESPRMDQTGIAILIRDEGFDEDNFGKKRYTLKPDLRERSIDVYRGAEMMPDKRQHTRCTQIDNLIYTILELRAQGKKHITPRHLQLAMLDRKLFSAASRSNFTELIALAVRRGFVNYIRGDDALFVSGFEWDEGAVEGDASHMPRMEKRDGRLVREQDDILATSQSKRPSKNHDVCVSSNHVTCSGIRHGRQAHRIDCAIGHQCPRPATNDVDVDGRQKRDRKPSA
ncbi:hypothetical protein QFC20_005613 [Naganishia adeliensis]|uniref:Uncharacterized protein n=1 Tax=Naganishia adeliensis TaxID=92952 RepID=A0ACC2VLH2_9TREE|nr:hypothetical protein QFC20_005613 [Naganishia adeliensis]